MGTDWDAVCGAIACSARRTGSKHQSSPSDSQPFPNASSRRGRPRRRAPAHENRSSTRSARILRHGHRLGRGLRCHRVQREKDGFETPKLTFRLPAVPERELSAWSTLPSRCVALASPSTNGSDTISSEATSSDPAWTCHSQHENQSHFASAQSIAPRSALETVRVQHTFSFTRLGAFAGEVPGALALAFRVLSVTPGPRHPRLSSPSAIVTLGSCHSRLSSLSALVTRHSRPSSLSALVTLSSRHSRLSSLSALVTLITPVSRHSRLSPLSALVTLSSRHPRRSRLSSSVTICFDLSLMEGPAARMRLIGRSLHADDTWLV